MDQAEVYSRINQIWQEDTQAVLDNYGQMIKWKGNDTLLDIGCGPGCVTVKLLVPKMPHNFKMVVGMDISEKMIEYAKEQYCNENGVRLSFVVGDIGGDLKHLSNHIAKYDHITSFLCLHFVQNQRKAFSNIYQMLKPGGDCLLQIIVGSPLVHLYKKMQMTQKWSKYMQNLDSLISPYLVADDPVALVKDYLKEWFNYYEVHVREQSFIYDDENFFKAFLSSINPCLKNVPKEKKDDYMSALFQHCMDIGMCKDNKYILPYKMLIVFSVK